MNINISSKYLNIMVTTKTENIDEIKIASIMNESSDLVTLLNKLVDRYLSGTMRPVMLHANINNYLEKYVNNDLSLDNKRHIKFVSIVPSPTNTVILPFNNMYQKPVNVLICENSTYKFSEKALTTLSTLLFVKSNKVKRNLTNKDMELTIQSLDITDVLDVMTAKNKNKGTRLYVSNKFEGGFWIVERNSIIVITRYGELINTPYITHLNDHDAKWDVYTVTI